MASFWVLGIYLIFFGVSKMGNHVIDVYGSILCSICRNAYPESV